MFIHSNVTLTPGPEIDNVFVPQKRYGHIQYALEDVGDNLYILWNDCIWIATRNRWAIETNILKEHLDFLN